MFFLFFLYFSENYENFDKKLNVVHMAELINDIYDVYDGNPDYCFLSIDVVKMFDEIPMSSVCEIIGYLDSQIEVGCYVNKDLLHRLVRMDCEYFNYFKFYEPPIFEDIGEFYASVILYNIIFSFNWF